MHVQEEEAAGNGGNFTCTQKETHLLFCYHLPTKRGKNLTISCWIPLLLLLISPLFRSSDTLYHVEIDSWATEERKQNAITLHTGEKQQQKRIRRNSRRTWHCKREGLTMGEGIRADAQPSVALFVGECVWVSLALRLTLSPTRVPLSHPFHSLVGLHRGRFVTRVQRK